MISTKYVHSTSCHYNVRRYFKLGFRMSGKSQIIGGLDVCQILPKYESMKWSTLPVS